MAGEEWHWAPPPSAVLSDEERKEGYNLAERLAGHALTEAQREEFEQALEFETLAAQYKEGVDAKKARQKQAAEDRQFMKAVADAQIVRDAIELPAVWVTDPDDSTRTIQIKVKFVECTARMVQDRMAMCRSELRAAARKARNRKQGQMQRAVGAIVGEAPKPKSKRDVAWETALATPIEVLEQWYTQKEQSRGWINAVWQTTALAADRAALKLEVPWIGCRYSEWQLSRRAHISRLLFVRLWSVSHLPRTADEWSPERLLRSRVANAMARIQADAAADLGKAFRVQTLDDVLDAALRQAETRAQEDLQPERFKTFRYSVLRATDLPNAVGLLQRAWKTDMAHYRLIPEPLLRGMATVYVDWKYLCQPFKIPYVALVQHAPQESTVWHEPTWWGRAVDLLIRWSLDPGLLWEFHELTTLWLPFVNPNLVEGLPALTELTAEACECPDIDSDDLEAERQTRYHAITASILRELPKLLGMEVAAMQLTPEDKTTRALLVGHFDKIMTAFAWGDLVKTIGAFRRMATHAAMGTGFRPRWTPEPPLYGEEVWQAVYLSEPKDKAPPVWAKEVVTAASQQQDYQRKLARQAFLEKHPELAPADVAPDAESDGQEMEEDGDG